MNLDNIEKKLDTMIDGQAETKKATDEIKVKAENAEKAANEAKTAIDTVKGEVENVKSEVAIIVKQSAEKAGQAAKEKSFGESLADAILAQKDALANIYAKGSKERASFDVPVFKAAATMTRGNYSGGTVGLSTWDPSFATVARRSPFLRQLVNVRPVSSQYVAWAEQANRDGGAGQTAEGAAKTQADFDIVEANKKVEKITSYIKVSKEALADIPFLQAEINNDLLSLVNLKLDTDLLSGGGVSPALKGILEYATTFAAPSGLELSIDNANELDALRAAIAQVENAHFSPNYIIMHPTDVAKIDMLKDTTNNYLTHQAAGQFMFKAFYGIPVVANTGMTQGDFLVGDFTKSNLGIREDVNISVGYDQDDFTKNLVTILAEIRAVHYIKSNHTTAFVKGDFATVKAALETV